MHDPNWKKIRLAAIATLGTVFLGWSIRIALALSGTLVRFLVPDTATLAIGGVYIVYRALRGFME